VPERILVVEDEATLCTNITRALAGAGHTVAASHCLREARAELDARGFDLVITDLRLPDGDGLGLLDHLRATSPDSIVLIMTAYASIDSAVEALRRGAHDYILKPLSLADLRKKVEHISEHRRLHRENTRLRTLLRGEADALALLRRGGRAMRELADLVDKVAASPSNVLVLGESGSGKELVARALHEASPRSSEPFVTLNLGAIPESLVESTLFGHERGAFTGADRRRDGLFRAASGGTLFLDEIGELPLAAQAKLLRAVESKEILPIGADRGLTVDTRIVAATHRDLGRMVAEGQFRQDLLYRIQVVQVRVPPLRERPADVPALARHFAERHARAQRKPIPTLAPEALARLSTYGWPGNVRELSNVIERAVLLCEDAAITPVDLPPELAVSTGTPPDAGSGPPAAGELETLEQAVLGFQRQHIARVLDRAHGNREAAARLLGLSPATFYRYLQKVGLKGYRSEGGGLGS
jgi:DNA-binding NtrC family response regulator